MNKNLQSHTSSAFKKAWLVLVCLMSTMLASAAEWTLFETGVKYDFKFMEDQNFKFVPTEDGILRIYAQETNISVSTDETTAGNKISAWKYKPTTDEDGTTWSGYTEASLKAGTPYFINVPGTLSKSTKNTSREFLKQV